MGNLDSMSRVSQEDSSDDHGNDDNLEEKECGHEDISPGRRPVTGLTKKEFPC